MHKFCLLMLVFFVLFGGLTSQAQEVTATIVGSVKDASGAVVPGAQVTVTNTDRDEVERTVTTSVSGDYVAPLLPIGHYKVEATAKTFSTAVLKGIELNVSDRYTANLVLQIGAVSQLIVVEANPLQVELLSPTATGLISGTEIRQLSLNNRNYEQMVALMPGVSYGGGDQLYIGTTNPSGQPNTVSFSINGARNSANNWTIDGSDNVDRGSNLTLINYPSVDAIAEFKVLRGLYSAEYGRGAGQVNVITRSGSDQFHGSGYEFFRNDYLNANDYFRKRSLNPAQNSTPAQLRYNDFGYTVGGPVVLPHLYNGKHKTFFFFSQEYRRVISYSSYPGIVLPTADEKKGIMQYDTCIAFNSDAKHTCATKLPKGTPLASVASINPIAAAYLKDIWANAPAPDDSFSHQTTLTGRNVFNNRQDLFRIDQNFGAKLSVFFRYINDTIPTEEPFGLFGPQSNVPGVANSTTKSPGRTFATRANYTINSSMILEGGYNYSRSSIISHITGAMNPANSSDIAAAIKGVLPYTPTIDRLPGISGAYAPLSGYGPYEEYNRNHTIFGNLSWIRGKHSFKFGAAWNNYSKTENAAGNNAGAFAFDATGAYTTGDKVTDPLVRNEQAWANFLTGNVATFSQVAMDITPYIRVKQLELFAQDEWRVKDHLTLSYGVRYSYFPQPYNDNNQYLSNFDPKSYTEANAVKINPATGNIDVKSDGTPTQGSLYNGLIYASGPMKNSRFGSKVGDSSSGFFAPRLGVAWDPFGTGKTSIRSGYGMFAQSSLVGTYEQDMFTNPPYSASLSIPWTSMSNPGGSAAAVSASPKALRGVPVTGTMPYTQQWSTDIQQQLPGNILFDMGYYGSKDTHLIGIVDLNQPKPGDYIAAGIGAPCVTGGTAKCITSGTITQLNAIRPYKGYSSINTIRPWFGGNYHSFQASLEKRFKGASIIKGNYTWSHGLTDSMSDRSNAPANVYDIHQNYGPTLLDRRHIFTGTYIYDIPFLQSQKGVAGKVLGGWQTSGVVSVASGLPLNISGNIPVGGTSSVDPAGQGCINSASSCPIRPNMVGNPNSGGAQTVKQWFNTAAFQANITPGQVGTAPSGAILGPGYWRVDMSLFKTFKFTESTNFEFRFETFNVFNHENFNAVNTTFGGSLFGQVTGSRDPRQIQLGAKLHF
ncbi:MAG TPA: carboxypeptidase regulatory-like domain-containing protein [Candidatus Saccharimonadales bacterium]|nr:carboxypeptidase regulatory-like domain-containing protein [Candidatus Saccharimonadales bacterium]